ncbi:MAG TPA: copper resistance protein CopC [Alphaproteobacteria bacterium]|nr:copper resistance protein CopC [Alphaproteobacteria bacterium]
MTRALFIVLLLCGLTLAAAPVNAHALLLGTTPADRETLAVAPGTIVLRFNEPVVPISARLLDERGMAVASDASLEAHDAELRLTLAEPLADGAYVFSYRITSEDSHPVAGTILFAVGGEPAAWRAAPVAQDNPLWASASAVNRAVHLAGLLGLAGGMAFLLLFPGERLADRRALAPCLAVCAALAASTALLAIGLQGAVLADAAPRELLTAKIWLLGCASTRGTAAFCALGAILSLVAALCCGARKERQALFLPLSLGGLALALLSFIVSGHAATAQPRWLTAPAMALHVAVAGLWLGSLLPLLRATTHFNKGSLPRIAAFSRTMSWALPLLALCGVALCIVQLQAWSALGSSRYGAILTLKLLFVGLLLMLAAHNKLRLTPALKRGEIGAGPRLARAIRCEIALGLAVLAATALLSQTVPPRSLGDHAVHEHGETLRGYTTVATGPGGRMALINVDPATAGRNQLDVRFLAADGRAFSPLEAKVLMSNELAGIEGLSRPLERVDVGHYRLSGPEFALPGAWRLRIDALVSDYEQASFVAAIPIAR